MLPLTAGVRLRSLAAAEHDDVFIAYQRPAPFDVGDDGRGRGERQIQRRRLAARLGFELVEVGVTAVSISTRTFSLFSTSFDRSRANSNAIVLERQR
jgi:hypothetical protein